MFMLKKVLIRISSNPLVQKLLEKMIWKLQHLMGIGSGGGVSSSGEQGVFSFMAEKYRPPYCIFDVGSNKGQFLELTLQNVNTDEFLIHCFEPGHETFKYFKENAGNDHRVRLNNFGLGRENGAATLHYNTKGSSLASLTKRNIDHLGISFDQSEKVDILTVDSYCEKHNIDRIHLLKIDVEGHELDVLAGAEKMFRLKSIDIVTFEFGGCNIDTRSFFRDFWEFFCAVNMEIFRVTPSGYLHPVEHYSEAYEQFRTTNFVALKSP